MGDGGPLVCRCGVDLGRVLDLVQYPNAPLAFGHSTARDTVVGWSHVLDRVIGGGGDASLRVWVPRCTPVLVCVRIPACMCLACMHSNMIPFCLVCKGICTFEERHVLVPVGFL